MIMALSDQCLRAHGSSAGPENLHLLIKEEAVLELRLHGSLRVSVVDWLVNANEPKEVVLHNAQVEKEAIRVPSNTADHGSCNSVQNEVVGRGDNGGKDESRVGHAYDDNGNALPGARSKAANRESGNRETDEERVAKVE